MKLYPPYIEGTIPAFCKNSEGTVVMTVPFSMNKAVSKSSVIGLYLKVKTVQSNTLLFTTHTTNYNIDSKYEAYFTLSEGQASKLRIGQYYKVQIAYQSSDDIGYYSTVAVVKFTTAPIITIADLATNAINMHKYSYTGHYTQVSYQYAGVSLNAETYKPNVYYILRNGSFVLCTDNGYNSTTEYFQRFIIADANHAQYKDTSEKEYYYRFTLTDKAGNIVDDSGKLLHDNSNDINSYESHDTYSFRSDLDENALYYIQYTVITNNNMEVSSPRYRVMQKASIAPEINTKLIAKLNFDNGYVNLSLQGELDDDGKETATTGSFLISRACSDDGYKIWNEVLRFTLRGAYPSRQLWKDFTVEQGKYYIYSLQQYNAAGLYSARILTDELFVDFEDAFLYDGERQLKIKYNPKITSFKTDYLETKTDTIGSKYPFIFRNGRVSYKEFPISGLVSYQSDEENLFMSNEDLGFLENLELYNRLNTQKPDIDEEDNEYFFKLQSQDATKYTSQVISGMKEGAVLRKKVSKAIDEERCKTTSLTGVNFSAERTFKLAVLDWLNNGKPKLFRSPSEGNYIVRLMNVSYSPDDKLSRLLHTFSGTAYEIADCSYDNLNAYDIMTVKETEFTTAMLWASIELATTEDKELDLRYNKYGDIYYAAGELLPVGKIATTVRFNDMTPGSVVSITQNGKAQNIVIGSTGSYEVNTGVAITSIYLPNISDSNFYQGTITYGYYNDDLVEFNTITTINIFETPSHQFIGNSNKTITKVISKEELRQWDLDGKNYLEIPSELIHSALVNYNTDNIIDQINNVKTILNSFYYLHFLKRDIAPAYYKIDIDKARQDAKKDIDLLVNINDYILGSAINTNSDPFYLYQYRTDKIVFNGNLYSGCYVPLKGLNMRDFDLHKMNTTSPYFKVSGKRFISIPATDKFNAAETYYEKVPFEMYFDPAHPEDNIISKESYEYLINMANIYKNIATPDPDLIVYSNEIRINGSTLDLTEILSYDIRGPIVLDEVVVGCGVLLECGYECQELIYSIEKTDNQLLELRKSLDTMMNGLSPSYRDIKCAQDNGDSAYAADLINLRQVYPIQLDTFIRELTIRKALKDEEAVLK